MSQATVLIMGAGPTGLVLALSLARRGVPFRLIEANAGPGAHSRATGLAMHCVAWSASAQDTGVERDAAHLIGPDGYVGFAGSGPSAAQALETYVRRLELTF